MFEFNLLPPNHFVKVGISNVDDETQKIIDTTNIFLNTMKYHLDDIGKDLSNLRLTIDKTVKIINLTPRDTNFYSSYSKQRSLIQQIIDLIKNLIGIVDNSSNNNLKNQRHEFINLLIVIFENFFINEFNEQRDNLFFYKWAEINGLVYENTPYLKSNGDSLNNVFSNELVERYYQNNRQKFYIYIMKNSHPNNSPLCLSIANPLDNEFLKIAVSLIIYLLKEGKNTNNTKFYNELKALGLTSNC